MVKNKLIVRVLAMIALVAFLAVSLITILPTSVGAESAQSKLKSAQTKQSELKSKINSTQSQINDNTKKKEAIDSEISKVQTQIDTLNSKIADSNSKIAAKQTELTAAEEESKEQYDNYLNRAKMMVERGSVTYLEVLLNSKSFSDLLARYSVVKQIVRYDSQKLDELKAIEKKIAAIKTELESEKANLVSLKADETAQMNTLSAKRAESQQIIAGLEADKSSYEQALDNAEKAEANARAEIKRLAEEAEKKAAAAAAARAKSSSGGTKSSASAYNGTYSGGMIWPSSGPVTSPYSTRVHPITGKVRKHAGIDIGSRYGSNIVAAAAGTVIVAGYNAGGYGNYVVISHGSGISTLYAHASSLCVSVGQTVSQGQVIAKVGSTGLSSGPHCHFEVHVNGADTNPMQYLP